MLANNLLANSRTQIAKFTISKNRFANCVVSVANFPLWILWFRSGFRIIFFFFFHLCVGKQNATHFLVETKIIIIHNKNKKETLKTIANSLELADYKLAISRRELIRNQWRSNSSISKHFTFDFGWASESDSDSDSEWEWEWYSGPTRSPIDNRAH